MARVRAQGKEPLHKVTLTKPFYFSARRHAHAVYTGDDDVAKEKAGWCGANSGRKLDQVSEKAPIAFGLYDTIGNVREPLAGKIARPRRRVRGPATGLPRGDPQRRTRISARRSSGFA